MKKVLMISLENTYKSIEKNISKDFSLDILTSTDFNINRLSKLLKNNKYDIVHINSSDYFSSRKIVNICKKRKIKQIIVYSNNNHKYNIFKKIIMKMTNFRYVKKVDAFLFNSKDLVSSLLIDKYKHKGILLEKETQKKQKDAFLLLIEKIYNNNINLEVLLSVMNFDKNKFSNMNITSKCTVINQCKKDSFEKYKNFNIYNSKENGLSNSRNLGLSKVSEDIIVLCDDDVVYNKDYESIILSEFKKNKDADIIVFNIDSPNRIMKINKKNKRLHFYNIQRYSSARIAFRRNSVKDIYFNTLFGSGSIYESGEDSLFLVESLNKHLKIYSSTKNIGVVTHEKSNWFKGYNEKYFFDKGALFTAISKRYRKLLMIQYLLRHKYTLKEIKFKKAYKYMKEGSSYYLKNNK